jgi:hypothetical protein
MNFIQNVEFIQIMILIVIHDFKHYFYFILVFLTPYYKFQILIYKTTFNL